jgi:hypothetical protein
VSEWSRGLENWTLLVLFQISTFQSCDINDIMV